MKVFVMSKLIKVLLIGAMIFFLLLMLLIFADKVLDHASGRTLLMDQPYFWVFTLWRYSLYILILMAWPCLIKTIGNRRNWPKRTIVYLAHQRFKLFFLFVLVEIFFEYNLLGHLIAWI